MLYSKKSPEPLVKGTTEHARILHKAAVYVLENGKMVGVGRGEVPSCELTVSLPKVIGWKLAH